MIDISKLEAGDLLYSKRSTGIYIVNEDKYTAKPMHVFIKTGVEISQKLYFRRSTGSPENLYKIGNIKCIFTDEVHTLIKNNIGD